MPSYNKSTQILKQQSIQKKQKTKVWISLTIVIATTTQKLQVSLNKQLRTTYKKG